MLRIVGSELKKASTQSLSSKVFSGCDEEGEKRSEQEYLRYQNTLATTSFLARPEGAPSLTSIVFTTGRDIHFKRWKRKEQQSLRSVKLNPCFARFGLLVTPDLIFSFQNSA